MITSGSYIKRIRKQKGMTLKELGEALDVSHAYLSKLENDKAKPNEQMIVKIHHELDDGNEENVYTNLMILSGYYNDSIEDSEVYNELLESGRIELDENGKIEILNKPYYQLNHLLETEQKVFYQIEMDDFTHMNIELPPTLRSKLNNHIKLLIQDEIVNNPELVTSQNKEAIDEYERTQDEKIKEVFAHGFKNIMRQINKTRQG